MAAAASCMLAGCATQMHDPRVDALMRDYDGDVPGASVLVVRDGRPIVRTGYGLADVESHTPVTAQTNFRLASMSKQFTARAIEILAQRGALSLDDPITRFLPSLPPYAQQMTVRQLLTHTSGLPDYDDDALLPKGRTTQLDDLDVLHILEMTDRPLFAPGSRYQYSNTGYVFLGLIVAKASGMSFADFLKREIFDPLGMRGTQMGPPPHDRAYGYTQQDGKWTRRDQSITSATQGDGGIYSSIDDLAKWDAQLSPGDFTVATDDPKLRYGFGWRYSEHRGHRMQWHSGETTSFRNVIVRFPDDRLTAIVLTNRDHPQPYQTALAIADIFWSAAAKPPL